MRGRPKLDRPNYRLKREPSGIFVIHWSEARKPRSLSTGTRDPAAAQVAFDQYIAGLEAPERPEQPTIAQILDHYLADREGIVASEGHDWACKALRRHIGNLKPEHLERRTYWNKRRKDRDKRRKAPVSAGTIIKEVGHLRAALELAAKDKLIPRPVPQIDRPSQPRPREIWITREEAAALRRAAVMPHVRLFIVLALATGARKEALQSLTWDRVDLDEGMVTLALPGGVTSNKRRATVPIDPAIVRYLRWHKSIAITKHVLEWRGKPAGDVKKGVAAAVRRAGLPKEITPHVLRHSVATWMVEDDVPTREVARFLGDTEAMVEKVYSHHRPSYLRRAMGALRRGRPNKKGDPLTKSTGDDQNKETSD